MNHLTSQFRLRAPATLTFTTILAFLSSIECLSLPAQNGPRMEPKQGIAANTDVSLGVFGQLTPTRTSTASSTIEGAEFEQKTQGASLSAGVLGTFHQSFRPWLGYNVNLGYSRFSENYSDGFMSTSSGSGSLPSQSFYHASIGTNMYELSGASVVEGPRMKRLSTFGQLGGGALFFLPTKDPASTSVQVRPVLVFGAGIDYKLSAHMALRAEYRGEFYKSPTFKEQELQFFTATNAPTISLVYSFGRGKHSSKTNGSR